MQAIKVKATIVYLTSGTRREHFGQASVQQLYQSYCRAQANVEALVNGTKVEFNGFADCKVDPGMTVRFQVAAPPIKEIMKSRTAVPRNPTGSRKRIAIRDAMGNLHDRQDTWNDATEAVAMQCMSKGYIFAHVPVETLKGKNQDLALAMGINNGEVTIWFDSSNRVRVLGPRSMVAKALKGMDLVS